MKKHAPHIQAPEGNRREQTNIHQDTKTMALISYMLIMTFLMVQDQMSPCKMKVHTVYMSFYISINCNYSPICHHFRDIDLQSYQKYSAGGPDAANDLELVPGINNLSIYRMPKYQI